LAPSAIVDGVLIEMDMLTKTLLAEHLFTIHGLLTLTECAELIGRGEGIGFEHAAVKTKSGPQMRPDIRDNDRAEFNDPKLATLLWERCKQFVPLALEGATAFGLDENFRFYRYDVGQRFKRHKDGVVERTATELSRLTCLFYLNEDFTGGETAFYADEMVEGIRAEVAVVTPRLGDALFFLHEWWHEGRELITGRKFVLRSDVFYRFLDESGS
jgi:predicted 2-oxoglutarate/Fe(II)-dependent dioxygenase YbiX